MPSLTRTTTRVGLVGTASERNSRPGARALAVRAGQLVAGESAASPLALQVQHPNAPRTAERKATSPEALGDGAQLTLSTYGHVIDELDDASRQDAQAPIQAARDEKAAHCQS